MEHIVKIEGVCKKHGSKQILRIFLLLLEAGGLQLFWVQMVQGKVRP